MVICFHECSTFEIRTCAVSLHRLVRRHSLINFRTPFKEQPRPHSPLFSPFSSFFRQQFLTMAASQALADDKTTPILDSSVEDGIGDVVSLSHLHRTLDNRQIQLIAIGGSIGESNGFSAWGRSRRTFETQFAQDKKKAKNHRRMRSLKTYVRSLVPFFGSFVASFTKTKLRQCTMRSVLSKSFTEMSLFPHS